MKPKYGWVYLSFVVSLAILVISSVSFYTQFRLLRNHATQLQHNHEVFTGLRNLKQIVLEAESSARGFMISGDSSYLSAIPSLRSRVSSELNSLKSLFGTDSPQHNRLVIMSSDLTRRINTLYRNLDRVARGDTLGLAESLKRGHHLMEIFKQESDEIESIEEALGNKTRNEVQTYAQLTPVSFNVMVIFSGILTLLSFLFIIREMRIRLRYQLELEKKLKELNSSTAELEQFTYVASHDLQEPLRKIRTFSDRLMTKHQSDLNPEAARLVERLDVSAHRMQDLIQDMIDFTTLVNKRGVLAPCDLTSIFERVLHQARPQMNEINAIVRYDKLPVITGFPEQLTIMFRALLDNSLKFHEPSRALQIVLNYHQVEGHNIPYDPPLPAKRLFHKISFRDNGIGFDNEFASRIFLIFKRLHAQDSNYGGKGIGLAIAQRVVSNHNGLILARGVEGEGATFSIYFPVGT